MSTDDVVARAEATTDHLTVELIATADIPSADVSDEQMASIMAAADENIAALKALGGLL